LRNYDRLDAVHHGKGEYAPHGALCSGAGQIGSNDLPPYAPGDPESKPVPPCGKEPQVSPSTSRNVHHPTVAGTCRPARRAHRPAVPVPAAPAGCPAARAPTTRVPRPWAPDRKSTRLNSSHVKI